MATVYSARAYSAYGQLLGILRPLSVEAGVVANAVGEGSVARGLTVEPRAEHALERAHSGCAVLPTNGDVHGGDMSVTRDRFVRRDRAPDATRSAFGNGEALARVGAVEHREHERSHAHGRYTVTSAFWYERLG